MQCDPCLTLLLLCLPAMMDQACGVTSASWRCCHVMDSRHDGLSLRCDPCLTQLLSRLPAMMDCIPELELK